MTPETRRTGREEASPVWESALLVPVPQAESVVQGFRARFDPSAPLGVPAHITVLYPFLVPEALDQPNIDELAAIFAGVAPFPFTLGQRRPFPGRGLSRSPANRTLLPANGGDRHSLVAKPSVRGHLRRDRPASDRRPHGGFLHLREHPSRDRTETPYFLRSPTGVADGQPGR